LSIICSYMSLGGSHVTPFLFLVFSGG